MQKLTAAQIEYLLKQRTYGKAEALLYLLQLTGQLPSLRDLAKRWGWSHVQVKRFIDYCQQQGWLQAERLPEAAEEQQAVPSKAKRSRKPTEALAVQGTLAADLTAGLPRVQRMKKPLTEEQAQKLVEQYTKPTARDILERMDNYAKLTNYVSTYKTALNWLQRSLTTGANNGQTNSRQQAASLASIRDRAAEYDNATKGIL